MSELSRESYRRAIEQNDGAAMMASFAEDAVAFVPVGAEPIRGAQMIAMFIGSVGKTFSNFRYTYQGETEDGMILEFEAEVAPPPGRPGPSVHLNAIDLLRFDDQNRIIKFTGVARPREALEALLAHGMGEVYARALGKPIAAPTPAPPPRTPAQPAAAKQTQASRSELAKSMVRFPPAMSLFGLRQMIGLTNSLMMAPVGASENHDLAGAFDAVSRTALDHSGETLRGLFDGFDGMQNQLVDSVTVGGDAKTNGRPGTRNGKSPSLMYFDALSRQDAVAVRATLADDLVGIGPIPAFRRTEGGDAFVQVLQHGIWPNTISYELRACVANDTEGVLLYNWFTRTSPEPVRIAAYQTYRSGVIQSIELFFDATPFQGPPGPQPPVQ